MSTLAEIRTLLAGIPALALPNRQDLQAFYHALRGPEKRKLTHPRLVVFAGAHPDFDVAPVEAEIAAMQEASHPLYALCQQIDTDFSLHELALSEPVAAMTDEDCGQAIAYGMMMVDESIDAIGVAAFGAGTGARATELVKALQQGHDPLAALQGFGGREIAATLGVILAARMARIPCVVGGEPAATAYQVLHTLNPDAVAHVVLQTGSDGAISAAQVLLKIQQASES